MEKLKTIYLQFRRRRTLFFIAFMGSTLAGLILVDLLQEMIDTAIRADIGRFRGFGIKFLWILGGYLAENFAAKRFKIFFMADCNDGHFMLSGKCKNIARHLPCGIRI